MILCKHCGWPLDTIKANCFLHDGSDVHYTFPTEENGHGAVSFYLPSSWCGAELSEEEMMDCIKCPNCMKFPFSEAAGINACQIVNVVCFEEER